MMQKEKAKLTGKPWNSGGVPERMEKMSWLGARRSKTSDSQKANNVSNGQREVSASQQKAAEAMVGLIAGADRLAQRPSLLHSPPSSRPHVSRNLQSPSGGASLAAQGERIQSMLGQTTRSRKDSGHASEERSIDFSLLTSRLEKLQQSMEENTAVMKELVEDRSSRHAEARDQAQLDYRLLVQSLGEIHAKWEKQSALTEELVVVARKSNEDHQTSTKIQHQTLERIWESQKAATTAVEQNGGEIDIEPIAEHMDAIREAMQDSAEQIRSLVELMSTRQQQREAMTPPNNHSAAVTPFNDYFSAPSPGTGDAKFLISALTSHLSKIQAVSEQNTHAIKALREKSALSSSTPQPDHSTSLLTGMLRETNEQLRALTQALTQPSVPAPSETHADHAHLEKRLEATSSHVRELMAGQRDLVHVMRALATSIAEQNHPACNHIVIPPPRKMGRKVVGFVYE